jgi:hypothetical protein
MRSSSVVPSLCCLKQERGVALVMLTKIDWIFTDHRPSTTNHQLPTYDRADSRGGKDELDEYLTYQLHTFFKPCSLFFIHIFDADVVGLALETYQSLITLIFLCLNANSLPSYLY